MRKILIVSGFKPFIEKEKSILDRAEFKIFTANSGKEALNIHGTEKVDIIITDLDMPDMSGDELCSIIRKDKVLKKVSMLMVCTNKETDLKRCADAGVNSYITKPIDPEQLVKKVSHLLNIPERKSYRVLIKVEVKGQFLNMHFFCSSQNLSASGILLETDKPLAKGDVISCSFFLPNSDRIIADCEVVRVVRSAIKTFQYGVRFLNLHPDSMSAIESFIKSWKGM